MRIPFRRSLSESVPNRVPKERYAAFRRLRIMSVWLIVALIAFPVAASSTAVRPNVVVILVDDMGWSDLGCYGADLHETPNIDHLAAESVRFSDAYAMPVCSPTRAALLTGRHAARVHMTIWSEGSLKGPQNRRLLQAESRHSLPRSETSLASHLHEQGYFTAMVGKWHLGDADHYPEVHGFDVNIGGTHWGAPQTYWWPYRGTGRFGPEFRYVPHLEFGHKGEYLTDRLTDEALRVLDHVGTRPFFLYLAHHAPHTPIEAKETDVRYFETKRLPGMSHQNAVYAAMIKSVDESVGRVLKRLEERGLDQNTVVVFASDNGGFIGVDRRSGQTVPVTNNAPLRSGKGSCYEGGVRVPMMIRWPGVSRPGTMCHEPVVIMDLFPTILGAAGVALPSKTLDGVDLRSLLEDPNSRLGRDALFFHYPHYYSTTTPVSAVRSGDWKLLEYYEDDHVELYNLKEDLGESTDLAKRNPEKAAQLRRLLQDWLGNVGAALPSRNPRFRVRE